MLSPTILLFSLPSSFHCLRHSTPGGGHWRLLCWGLQASPHVCFMQLGLTSTCRDAREFIRPFFFPFIGVDKPSLFCYYRLCWGISVVWTWVTVKVSKSCVFLYSIFCQAAGCLFHLVEGTKWPPSATATKEFLFQQSLQHLASSNFGPISCLKMTFLSMSPTLEPSDCFPGHCRNLHKGSTLARE